MIFVVSFGRGVPGNGSGSSSNTCTDESTANSAWSPHTWRKDIQADFSRGVESSPGCSG
jgi:hypothetical protein